MYVKITSLHTPDVAAKAFPTTDNVTYVRMYWVPFPLSNEMIAVKLITETAKTGGQVKFWVLKSCMQAMLVAVEHV